MGAPADGDGARTKVLVLGGGPAALAAACELTATEQLRERYEVTVLQIGWRLGGKGASGRNAAQHQRIEEHGLHVWLGCYDNAFALMRHVYAELGRPAGAPLATWQEAFEPCDDVVLYEDWHGRRVGHRLHFPRSPLAPGEERERTLGEMLHEAVGWVAREWEGLREGDPDLHAAAAEAPPLAERHQPRGILHRLVDDLERFAGGAETEAIRAGGALLHGFRDWLWAHVVQRR